MPLSHSTSSYPTFHILSHNYMSHLTTNPPKAPASTLPLHANEGMERAISLHISPVCSQFLPNPRESDPTKRGTFFTQSHINPDTCFQNIESTINVRYTTLHTVCQGKYPTQGVTFKGNPNQTHHITHFCWCFRLNPESKSTHTHLHAQRCSSRYTGSAAGKVVSQILVIHLCYCEMYSRQAQSLGMSWVALILSQVCVWNLSLLTFTLGHPVHISGQMGIIFTHSHSQGLIHNYLPWTFLIKLFISF